MQGLQVFIENRVPQEFENSCTVCWDQANAWRCRHTSGPCEVRGKPRRMLQQLN